MSTNNKPKIIGIIPARGGSKSIPYKNIAPICGKPLIYYTIREAKRSKRLEYFLVSTDSEKIAKIAKEYGADVPFYQPKEIATDTTPDLPVYQFVLNWLEKNRGWKPEIIVWLRPTAPLRTYKDIDRVIQVMQETGCDSVRTITIPKNPPFKMWRYDEKTQRITPFIKTKYYEKLGTDVPRQLLPRVYWQNAAVDATRTKFIKDGHIYGDDIRGVIMREDQSVDLDSQHDLMIAEMVMKKLENLGIIEP